MADVLLATSRDLPTGEPAAVVLDSALAALGVSARWVVWDDPAVDWAAARLVAVRSTWDYMYRVEDFVSWARDVESKTALLNGAEVFTWNTDKRYLVELGSAGVPVVPTISVDTFEGLAPAVTALAGPAVIKPRISAGGRGILVVSDPCRLAAADVGSGPWVVQPMVDSIRTEGELSVFVVDGQPTCAVRKLPREGDIRVHEEFGGSSVPVALQDEAVAVARHCVRATQGLLGRTLHYARVDQLRLPSGKLAVSELEATEPGLYLDVVPGNAEAFANLLRRLSKDH